MPAVTALFRPAATLGLAAFLLATVNLCAVHAQVVNGSFETGASENSATIPGWDTTGNAFLSTTTRFSTPSAGTYQATLATILDGQFGERAGTGVSATTAETFLGVSDGSLANVGNGRANLVSAIRQTLRLNAGDTLFFDYNFLTDEVYKATDPSLSPFDNRPAANRNDFGFLSYSVGGTSGVTKLIDTFYGYSSTGPGQSDFTTGLTPTPDTDPLFSESGYLSGSFTALTTGDYVIGFGIANAEQGAAGVSRFPSGLLVDNVRLQAAPVVPAAPTAPEPGSIALLLTAGIPVAGIIHRRKK